MSKLIMFEFWCPACAAKFDDLVKPTKQTAPCPQCGGAGKRLISAPRIDPRLGVDAKAFPTMGDKWAKVRRQRKVIEEKRAREHGPDPW